MENDETIEIKNTFVLYRHNTSCYRVTGTFLQINEPGLPKKVTFSNRFVGVNIVNISTSSIVLGRYNNGYC